jgi:hypothetical protein
VKNIYKLIKNIFCGIIADEFGGLENNSYICGIKPTKQ